MKRFTLSAFADEAAADLDAQIAALAENNIAYIELRGVDGVNVADLTPAHLQRTREKLRAGGIRVSAIGSPIGKVSITAPFAPELERLCRVLEIAGYLEAPAIRLFSFYLPEEEVGEKIVGDSAQKTLSEQPLTPLQARYRDEVLLRLSRFLEKAKGSGVMLGHENEEKIFGESPRACLEIAALGMGMVFDPCNFVLCGHAALPAYALLRPHIAYLHIKDARDGRVVPPGEGECHIAELLQRQKETPCFLTLEPHLAEFVGLSAQHQNADVSHFSSERFSSNRAAFNFAAQALWDIMREGGVLPDSEKQ